MIEPGRSGHRNRAVARHAARQVSTKKNGIRLTWILTREFTSYRGIVGMRLVGGQVYGARFERAPLGENGQFYEGHFPKEARWWPERDRTARESRLPERFRGRIEYREPASFIGFGEDGEPYIIRDSLAAVWPHVLTDAEREERRKQREEERRKR